MGLNAWTDENKTNDIDITIQHDSKEKQFHDLTMAGEKYEKSVDDSFAHQHRQYKFEYVCTVEVTNKGIKNNGWLLKSVTNAKIIDANGVDISDVSHFIVLNKDCIPNAKLYTCPCCGRFTIEPSYPKKRCKCGYRNWSMMPHAAVLTNDSNKKTMAYAIIDSTDVKPIHARRYKDDYSGWWAMPEQITGYALYDCDDYESTLLETYDHILKLSRAKLHFTKDIYHKIISLFILASSVHNLEEGAAFRYGGVLAFVGNDNNIGKSTALDFIKRLAINTLTEEDMTMKTATTKLHKRRGVFLFDNVQNYEQMITAFVDKAYKSSFDNFSFSAIAGKVWFKKSNLQRIIPIIMKAGNPEGLSHSETRREITLITNNLLKLRNTAYCIESPDALHDDLDDNTKLCGRIKEVFAPYMSVAITLGFELDDIESFAREVKEGWKNYQIQETNVDAGTTERVLAILESYRGAITNEDLLIELDLEINRSNQIKLGYILNKMSDDGIIVQHKAKKKGEKSHIELCGNLNLT